MENLKKWRKLLELAISICLIWLIIYRYQKEIAEWVARLSSFNVPLVILAIFIFMLGNLINAYKWQLIARSIGISVGYGKALHYYMVGIFMNTILVGGAGEIKRTCDLSRDNQEYLASFMSVIMERWTGFCALLLMAVIGLFIQYPSYQHTIFPAVLGIIVLAGITVSVLLFGSFRKISVLSRFERLKGFVEKYEKLSVAFSKNKSLLIKALLISFPQPILVIAYFYLLSQSLNTNFPLQVFFFTVPFILIISQIPISIAGIGVQETCIISVFAPLNLGMGAVIPLSILSHIGKVVSCLWGAGYYFLINEESAKSIKKRQSCNEAFEPEPVPAQSVAAGESAVIP
jgi:uncharacterized protein (TIRG00374 family)